MHYYYLLTVFVFSLKCSNIEASSKVVQYHVMNINNKDSTISSTACNRSTSTTAGRVLRLAHKFQNNNKRPSSADILSVDQLRVDHIRARLQSSSSSSSSSSSRGVFLDESKNLNNTEISNSTTSLPARSGVPLGVGNYVVQFGHLGTLMFDTGSDLTWTTRARNPSSSDIECHSTECMEFKYQNTGQFQLECEDLSECDFTIAYGDNTTIEGILTKQNLAIITNSTDDHVNVDVFPDFIMGYLDHQQPFGNNIDGLLGLSRGDYSFVSQTAGKYGECFRYCLPSNENSTGGYLAFGNEESSSDHIANNFSTPFTRQYDRLFYYVEITSIFVGGSEIDHPVVEAIIDSGTVITRLPKEAYTAMRDMFRQFMTENNYTTAPAISILDTCYDTSNIANMSVPAVSFTFNGNVTVEFDPSGILYAINSSLACFAFANTTYSDGIVIFGNTQQRTYEVVYDVANNKLGFRPNACN